MENRKLNRKGFTLPEVLIAFALISMVMVWVTQSVPSIRKYNSDENDRIVALVQNINTMEMMKNTLYETGKVAKLSGGEMSGSENGNYFSTFYEDNGFEASTDTGSELRNIIDKVLRDPSLEELRPSSGTTSELYRITLNTTVNRKKIPRSSITSFIYANTSPTSNIKTDGLKLWVDLAEYRNTDSNRDRLSSKSGNIEGSLIGFGYDETGGWTGESLKFDGVDDEIVITETPELKPKEFAIELDIKPIKKPDGKRHVVFESWQGYTVEINANGSISFGVGGNGSYLRTNANVINWGEFQHITVVNDGVNHKIYVEGELVITRPKIADPTYTSGRGVHISPNRYDSFKGEIRSIRFYNGIMVDEEVKRNYLNTRGD